MQSTVTATTSTSDLAIKQGFIRRGDEQNIHSDYIGKKRNYVNIEEQLEPIITKTKKNYKVAENYRQLYIDTGECHPELLKYAENVQDCCSVVWFNSYRKQQINDFLKINPCHNKFCPCCQAKSSQARKKKYFPKIKELRKDYSVWMFVLTVPNCSPEELGKTTDRMIKAHRDLALILCGNKKIKGIDFSEYGIVGGLRNYELTASIEKGCHPHFHDIVILEKSFNPKRKYINDYSYRDGKLQHKFSELEILIQKIWYLLYNGIRVTKKNIDNLKQGYSVFIQRCESEKSLNECFKYSLKGAFSKNGNFIYDYEYFKNVFFALSKFSGERICSKRLFQGFGILYNIGEPYCEEAEREAVEAYQSQLDELYKIEQPTLKFIPINAYIEKETKKLTFGEKFIRSSIHDSFEKQGKLNYVYVPRKDLKRRLATIRNPIIEKHEKIRSKYRKHNRSNSIDGDLSKYLLPTAANLPKGLRELSPLTPCPFDYDKGYPLLLYHRNQ